MLEALNHWMGRLFLANTLAIGIGGSLNYLVHNIWTWQRERG
jgi:putative flippase GtrA